LLQEFSEIMKTLKLPTVLAGALLIVGVSSTACVADRPSRNGVFNENQYLRKDFLIQGVDANGSAADGAQGDPGWLVRATVTETSTPNLLGNGIGVWAGEEANVNLVRFRVTSDHLQLLDQVQFSNPQNPGPSPGTTGSNYTGVTDAIINAWAATNVDLKYQVNLDGEETNFYQENQELDWQVRQWVKLTFDKNDYSDLAPLGYQVTDMLGQCADVADASASLVTGSFNVEGTNTADTSDDYFEFTVQVGIPMAFNLGTTDATNACLSAYGPALANALRIGRTTVTVNLKYSFMRAQPITPQSSYVPFLLAEKDPIHMKYGPFLWTVWDRDPATDLIAANQYVGRFDPLKPIVWYFDPGFPEYYKPIFTGGTTPGAPAGTPTNPGIMAGTNAVLAKTGAPVTVTFLNYNDQNTFGDGAGPARNFGDIRYNFLRWISDEDMQGSFAGVTMPGFDPRTGEIINEGIEFNDFAVRDYYVQRIDAFLQEVGASGGVNNSVSCTKTGQTGCWQSGPCTAGTTAQIVNQTVIDNHNALSTLFTKMQTYLGLNGPNPNDNHLGPQDFTAAATEDQDFLNAYFTLVPYEEFADPDMNLFVTREGGAGVYGPASMWTDLQGEANFQALTATINSGAEPFDTSAGATTAADFANQMRAATESHQQYALDLMARNRSLALYMDGPGAFSLETVMEQDAQQCINGTWQSQAQWTQSIIDAYWQQVFWHEFGHSMGMEHNFMGNVDQLNFTPRFQADGKTPVTDTNGNQLYQMYSSSVMEYSANPARLAWTQGWGAYDKGAIAWIYANNAKEPDDTKKDTLVAASLSRSGEIPGTTLGTEYPYKDPFGFCNLSSDNTCPLPTLTALPHTGIVERAFLRCDETHMKYTPLCRQGDLGVTPSQIMANDIEDYEWQYQWRNFRDYRKVWDNSAYASAVSGFITDSRRFISQWYFDWSPGEISTLLYRVGLTPPVSEGAVSAADYYGELSYKFLVEMSKANQMVGAFDEAIIQQAAGERPYATVYDKFYGDVTQQGIILDKYFAMQTFVGLWPSDNYDVNQAGAYISTWSSLDYDDSFQSVVETAITSMVGSQYAVYPYFIPTAVALFAQDTHNPAFISSSGRVEAKDWIGGWSFGGSDSDGIPWSGLQQYFQVIATANGGFMPQAGWVAPAGVQQNANGFVPCTTWSTCPYDPTNPQIVSQNPINLAFQGPDGLNYVYAYLPSRNQIILAREDRNIVTWKLLEQYNTDVVGLKDDGSNGTYGLEYQIKYTIDAYNTYESGNPVPAAPTDSSN
jgi:hypothetical protein